MTRIRGTYWYGWATGLTWGLALGSLSILILDARERDLIRDTRRRLEQHGVVLAGLTTAQ